MASGKCRCPPPPMEIPKWFVTYSDVITLLMTFFILLLTFANSEPENFEKMQVATFGGAGSGGLAGPPTKGIDKDSVNVRYRPSSSRSTPRGTEMTPTELTPIGDAASKGLDALDNPEELASAERTSTTLLMESLRDGNGQLTSQAMQQLRMIAIQMKSLPLSADLQISAPDDLDFAVGMARYMQDELNVPSGRLSVSIGTSTVGKSMKITMTRTKD
ncbi:MAG: flagellar motor protein MotB [Planctomycetaceae bacterium]|nr:flagellar motor protein MotB [Planctomycetaceae bacterium]